jgi:hypothetical protein
MHNPGGCYGDNLACACTVDRDGVQHAAQPDRLPAPELAEA